MVEVKANVGANDTVMVALNRATGIQFSMPDGRQVLINGGAVDLQGKKNGVIPVGAYGLTEVATADWAYIEKTYGPHMDIFKNGLIFSTKTATEARKEARNRESLRHGLEPVDTSKTKTRPDTGK